MTANMLDEGAGKNGSVALAKALEGLGASVHTNASYDWSSASLIVTKKNVGPAFALFADVVARPRFDAPEWKRVHDLWVNDLTSRAREPQSVAQVVASRVLYADGAYGHPVEGLASSAKHVTLADVRAAYKTAWRPDAATLVVVGDITRADVDALIGQSLGDWKAPAGPKPAVVTTTAPPALAPRGAWPRVALVDRADAPQSVIALVRPARPASDVDAPILTRVNIALGGSFTSRLNQDLREEHGWSYGARSRVALLRGPGSILATAAVQTEHTGDALKAMVKDVEDFSRTGLTTEEIGKTRLIARSELVDMFEEAESAATRLARDAALGLGPDYEATASVRRDTAAKEDLARLVREFDPKDAAIIVVGPRAKLEKQLQTIGIEAFDLRDAEGKLIK
jgi:predicted Zn-dependent peptidase